MAEESCMLKSAGEFIGYCYCATWKIRDKREDAASMKQEQDVDFLKAQILVILVN